MSFSVKKAGVQFYITVDTGADLVGIASNFALTIRNNSNGDTSTGITTGSFSELAESPGTYQATATVTNPGDYTVIIQNPTNNLGNITAPLIVTNATIDDVYDAVDTLETISNNIYNEVQNLDGDSISAVQTAITNLNAEVETITGLLINKEATLTFANADESANFQIDDIVTGQNSGAIGTVKTVNFNGTDTIVELIHVIGKFDLANNEEVAATGTTTTGIDSISYGNTGTDTLMEFVEAINNAINNGDGVLDVLTSYTDDIENMLLGTEFLADGTTPNPFYDATNPGVAKESTVLSSLATLQSAITTAESNINAHTDSLIGASTDTTSGTLFGDLYLLKQVVDANRAHLEDSGYGLEALQTLINNVQNTLGSDTDVAGGTSIYSKIADVTAELTDANHGLSAIRSLLDTMDLKLDSIESKVDSLSEGASGARVYV